MIPNMDQTKFLWLWQFYQFHDSALANVSFQDKVKIEQISFAISVEHLPKKHGPKQLWGIYSSENGLKKLFLCY